MKDISKYVSKNTVKPVLNYVYVHMVDGFKYAVATDSFRLARVIVFKDFIPCGYYEPQAWSRITKLVNKDKAGVEILEVVSICKQQMASQIEEDYPKYQSILPKEKELVAFTGKHLINGVYLCELIKTLQTDKFKQFDFKDLLENDNQVVHISDDFLVMIMKMSG